jgi:prepilin-type N-terminal cleavage/methylation domain-containing protein
MMTRIITIKPVKAFTLVEILIVVLILGILAAAVAPSFNKSSTEAKSASTKENIQAMRTAIERYALEHKDVPPGYSNGNIAGDGSGESFYFQLTYPTDIDGNWDISRSLGYRYGPYLNSMPKNPFNGSKVISSISSTDSLESVSVPADTGWLYHGKTMQIYLYKLGTDNNGEKYLNY